MESSFVTLDETTKLAGYNKTGLLFMVQSLPDFSTFTPRGLLRVLTFDPVTQLLDTFTTVAIYQNKKPDQTGFHKACLNNDGTVLGIYVQYSTSHTSEQVPPSWFIEIHLESREVRRNPCSSVKLESNFSQVYHTDTKYQWIMAGFPLGGEFQSFEFYSFTSGKGQESEYFAAVLLTVASPISRGQQLGVVGDKLYSIYAEREEGCVKFWKFNFYNLRENNIPPTDDSINMWHSLLVKTKSSSVPCPEKLVRLFIAERRLCALELSKADNELKIYKVERPNAKENKCEKNEARLNQWKTYDILGGNFEIYDLQVSSEPVENEDHLVAFKMFRLPRKKLQYNMDAVHVTLFEDGKKTVDLSPVKKKVSFSTSLVEIVENHVD